MTPDETLSMQPSDFTELTIEEKFLRFARATVDTLQPHPDLAQELSGRLASAGLESLSRSLQNLSDRTRYPSAPEEAP